MREVNWIKMATIESRIKYGFFHQGKNDSGMPQGFVTILPLMYISFTDEKGGSNKAVKPVEEKK